jgi:hypothetical protein
VFEFNPPQEKLRYEEDEAQAPVEVAENRRA